MDRLKRGNSGEESEKIKISDRQTQVERSNAKMAQLSTLSCVVCVVGVPFSA
jgi:hypothetical protein